jgi:signal transduction histidine kinase
MLTVILGTADDASRRLPSDHPASQDLKDLMQAAQRAIDLNRQLLIFTRQHSSNPSAVDLNVLVLRLERMLSRLLGARIKLLLSLEKGALFAWVDEAQMEQVLVNLTINARDAMPKGGALSIQSARLRLSRAQEDEWDLPAGDYVMLSVRDTGTGIKPETKGHLFEPFFTTKAPGHGTGLGLSSCYGVVRKAGGDIRVTSEWGQGTTFDIALPWLPEASLPLSPVSDESAR